MRFLSKILFYLSSFSILPPRRSRQEEIIESTALKHKSSDVFLKNSLCQYDCHSFYFLKILWLAFNLFSVVTVLPLLVILLVRFKKVKVDSKSDISLYPKIPLEIKNKFHPEYIKKPMGYLKKRDLKYIFKILFKTGWRPYFVFRSVWKIAVYSELIDAYSPQRIWVTQEMVFESSLLTAYLNDFNVKHVNFMHGDNYFSLQVAFCTFDEFYVWDENYIRLFQSLQCSVKEYHTFCALDSLISSCAEKNVVKYYHQESRNQKCFNEVLDNLVAFSKTKNCDLVVRLHPLHKKQYEIDILKKRDIQLESNDSNVIESICESRYVCSEFSSVLYQATLLRKAIVIDNTFPERIELIKELSVLFDKKIQIEYLVTS